MRKALREAEVVQARQPAVVSIEGREALSARSLTSGREE